MHWSEYVTRQAGGRDQTDIAALVGVSQGTVSRWMSGSGSPSAEKVIAFARAVGDSPISALVAAGYVREQEADDVVTVAAGLSDTTAAELIAELARRLGVSVTTRGVKGA